MLRTCLALALLLAALAGCSSPSPPGVYKLGSPYQIQGRWYYPEYDPNYDRVGVASWYGEPFHGHRTANGEVFDRDMVTAAHPTLPLPSLVRVVNLQNRRELVVRVNDRGPFVDDRLIDLSQEAARQLGFEGQGLAPVRVQFVSLADAKGAPPQPTVHQVRAPASAPGGEPARQPTIRQVRTPASAPRGAPAPQLVATAAAQCRGPFIQVGAFSERARAQRLMAELHALQPMPVTLARLAEDQLARVRLGPIPDATTAYSTLDRLKRSGFSEAFIITPEKELASSC
jgi:rare lipoprotein A